MTVSRKVETMSGSDDKVKLGVIGLGHWFDRLEKGLADSSISIAKAMGTKSFAERAQKLGELGIGPGSYFIGSMDGSIPDGFFDGIDAVYVSSPNSLHYRQAVQSLENAKCVVVEKTLATNERDFEDITRLISTNGYSGKTYLHLHYLHKQLTLTMDGVLSGMERDHGKVTGLAATFLEPYRESDRHRKWLFSSREGGIFMDWIHPYEVLFHGAKAESVALRDANLFVLNKDYGADASGIEALADVSGRRFRPGAKATIRVGKGARSGMKRVRMYLEDGAHIDFDFANNEDESGTGHRGSWSLFSRDGSRVRHGKPKGLDTSEIFARDIVELCRGNNVGLSMDEIRKLYAPQWEFQHIAQGKEIVTDDAKVSRFVDDALSCRA